MSINIENKAFAKLMLHCLKHTKSDCYGILIGNNSGQSEDVSVSDVIPLSHDKVFTPQLEIALKFIELGLDKGKEIIGFYENLLMNNLKGSASISQLSYSVLENIHNKKFKFPILLEIFSNEIQNEGRDIKVLKEEPVINIYRYSKLTNNGSNFDFVGMHNISQEQFTLMAKLLKDNKQNEIVDFDDHFLDAELDWRNNFIEL